MNALAINFMGYDAGNGGPLKVDVTLYYPTGSAYFSGSITTYGAQNFVLPVVATQTVDRIVIDFVAPKGVDYRIDELSVQVPEPASLSLLGLAVVPLLLRRRR